MLLRWQRKCRWYFINDSRSASGPCEWRHRQQVVVVPQLSLRCAASRSSCLSVMPCCAPCWRGSPGLRDLRMEAPLLLGPWNISGRIPEAPLDSGHVLLFLPSFSECFQYVVQSPLGTSREVWKWSDDGQGDHLGSRDACCRPGLLHGGLIVSVMLWIPTSLKIRR